MATNLYKIALSSLHGLQEVPIPVNGDIVCLLLEDGVPTILVADFSGGSSGTEQTSIFLADLNLSTWSSDYIGLSAANHYFFRSKAESSDGTSRWALFA